MRAVALVIAVVLAVIGIGVGVVGGVPVHGVPNGWVPVFDQEAQVAVPANWEIVINYQGCGLPENPAVIYVWTPTFVPGFGGCPSVAIGAQNAPVVVMQVFSGSVAGMKPTTINGINAWTDDEGEGPEFAVPSLGVELIANNDIPVAMKIIRTLTTAPA